MGWGAHLERDMLQGKWEPQEQRLHSNLLEMRAVAKGFSFAPGAKVLVSSDNSMVVSYINREGGTRSFSLWKETDLVFQQVINLQISIGVIKMYVIADLLSRQDQTLSTEWSLNPEITRHLFLLWGSPHVDLFATRWNTKLPTFESLVPDPQAHAFPPHQLFTKVLTKLCQSMLNCSLWPQLGRPSLGSQIFWICQ